MVQHCPRCQRPNPAVAVFCHYDGAELRAGGGSVYRGGELGREFVFPSGRRCKTFDELVRGCSEEWSQARDMLRQGSLQQFLAGIGRADLSLAAQQAARESDPDLGLDQFLSKLPVRDGLRARLDLLPRRLNLGRLRVGESRQCQLKVINQGSGLLHGTVHVEGGEWVHLGQASNGHAAIKTGRQQVISVQIDTLGLVAGQPYAAKLVVITNGGVAELPIHLEVLPAPFAQAPLQGCTSPRELAGRMKEFPKQAVPLLESGEVQRWFAANGWHYPIQGSQAKGVACVQQFFEALGLSRPPVLTVSEREVALEARVGQIVHGQITLQTSAKKWIYARVESDSPWLTVDETDVGGAQQVTVGYQASARRLTGGWKYQGHLTILANGGQKFVLPVRLETRSVRLPLGERLLRALLIGALFGLGARLLASLPDLLARDLRAFGGLLQFPDEAARQAYVRRFVAATGWLGPLLGGLLLWRRSGVRDLLPGMIVGVVAGLAAAATLASGLLFVDSLVHRFIPVSTPGAALAVWALAGALVALALGLLGQGGRTALARLAQPVGWLLRSLGLRSLGDWLTEET